MKDDAELTTLAGGSLLTLIGMTVALSLEFMIRVVIARSLNPSSFGTLFLGLKILNILLFIAILGMDNGSTTKISFFMAHGNKKETGEIMSTTLLLTFCTACITTVTLWIISDSLASIFMISELSLVLKVLSIGILPIVLVRVLTAFFRGMQRFKPKLIFEDGFFFVARFISIITIALFITTLEFFALAISVSAMVVSLFYVGYFKRSKRIIINVSSSKTKELLLFSLPLALQMFTYQMLTSADIIIIGIFATSSIVGLYSSVIIFSQFTPIGTQALYFAFLPGATDLYARGDLEQLKKNYLVASKWGLLLSLVVFMILESFPRTCLSIFGPEYIAVYPWLEILVLGYLIHAAIGLSGPTLIAINQPRYTAFAWGVSAITTFMIAFFTVPLFGPIAAPISIGIGFLLVNLIHLVILWNKIKLHPLGQGAIRALLLSFLLIFLMRIFLPEPSNGFSLLLLFPLAVILCLAYIIGILFVGVMSEEDLLFLKILEDSIGRELNFVRRLLERFVKTSSEKPLL